MKKSCVIVFASQEIAPRFSFDAVDIELVLSYEKNEWIQTSEENGELIIRYNGYVGILPLANNFFLAMLPKEFSSENLSNFYDLATFLVNHYGKTPNMMNYSAKESDRYTFENVFTLYDLALKLKDELLKLKYYPLPNFIREQKKQKFFSGKINTKSLIKTLFTKPGSDIVVERNRISLNTAENQIIKAALKKILNSKEIKEYHDLSKMFNMVLSRFSEVENVSPEKLKYTCINNAKIEYKFILIISRIILFDQSNASSREIISLGIPLIKTESDFFEVLSREAIKYSFPSTVKGQYIASSEAEIKFNPDIVIDLKGVTLVGDSKYKTLTPGKHGIDNKADIYQLITHSLGYENADRLFLLYPVPLGSNIPSKSIYYDKISPRKTVTAIWLNQEVLLKATVRRTRDQKLFESIQELINELINHHSESDKAA